MAKARPPPIFGGAAFPADSPRSERPNRFRSQMLPVVRILPVIIGLLSALPASTADLSLHPTYRSSGSPGSPIDLSAGHSHSRIARGGGGVEGGSVDQWHGVSRQHAQPVMCLRGGSGAAIGGGQATGRILGGRYIQLDEMLEKNRAALLAEYGGEAGVRIRSP